MNLGLPGGFGQRKHSQEIRGQEESKVGCPPMFLPAPELATLAAVTALHDHSPCRARPCPFRPGVGMAPTWLVSECLSISCWFLNPVHTSEKSPLIKIS